MGTQKFQELVCKLAGARDGANRPKPLSDRLNDFVSELNRDETVVYPEELDQLTVICEAIDSEVDVDLAWQKVLNIELTGVFEQPFETDVIMNAVGRSILGATVAYLNTHDEVASGVLIDIDGRCFLATTAHSVPANPRGRLSFIGNEATPIRGNVPHILTFGKDENDDERDVAFIEVDPEFVAKRFGKAAIPLSRILPCGAGQPKVWTLVGGYPSSEVRDFNIETTPAKLFTMQCWGSPLLMSDKWAALPECRRLPDPRLDVFIQYPRYDDFVSCGDIKPLQPDELALPFGMSGGGYWQPNSANRTRVWTPESYSLIAIQSRWWGRDRYLQGTQIIHWIRLVWKHLPELRQSLDLAFAGHDLSS